MKIFTKVVMNWDGEVQDQDSFDYEGPVALCGGGGGKGKTPDVPPTPPKPATGKDVTAAATEAVNAQDEKRRKYAGQQSTILTSPLGAAPVQQQGKTMLGQ